ncbi:MAG: hypothetical protein WBC85_16540 [Planktotalea sp.]|uniref:hypothetical protein n=1 Tax=Planktotalea sp. TaxID=2029877 RepID=UPI003C70F4AE
MFNSPYFDQLKLKVDAFGGYHNGHLHLGRVNTFDDSYLQASNLQLSQSSHISLQEKHALISKLHASRAYDADDYNRRISEGTDVMIGCGTKRADTVVDVTNDRVQLSALTWMMEHAESIKDKLILRAASYNPTGFTDADPARWNLFEEGAKKSDFIGALPEKDDHADYPDHIGYEESCARVLDLARRLGKMVQVHTDQRNDPREDATERLLDVIEREGGVAGDDLGGPMIWAVHMISPSAYDEPRWERLLERLLANNVGVIVAPSAALGMRQLRSLKAPTHNSIARVLDLAAAGVPVRLGSDNVCDMLSPSSTLDLMSEVYCLTAALRFYQQDILAKLATGTPLSGDDRAHIKDHLAQDAAKIASITSR